ncbi:HAD-IA family hydrolase [Ciceribacter sp. RN22]|uniref:HAD-IA family hydrolase n=1 Tax=Ciceribacter sp. RN22 TaxID=2954932 RepID=UPI002092F17B|nr:HAD-IA family hydrolase [Ciceribacter sp. RN22]MCO6179333.1 HAD-IA family hydrolase [Ciceribacter sp. RN22]
MMRALVLDFGGVISKTLFETHSLSEAALGLPSGTLTWRGPFDPDGDDAWRAMQAGEMTERDYWALRMRETGALIGEAWTEFPEFVGRLRGAEPEAVIRPEALDAITRAKASGYKLAILSNELDLFYGKDFRSRLPFLADFDLIVDATYTGILKPDPRAFRFVTDGLAIEAKDCVFVDDQAKNLNGAVAVGMPYVHFDVTRPGESYALALDMLAQGN